MRTIAYVAFTEPVKKRWWGRLLRKGYRHCFVFRPDPATLAYIATNATAEGYLEPMIFHGREEVLLFCRRMQATEVLAVPVRGSHVPALRGALTCVSITKAVLRVHSWAITPWQLRQYLVGISNGHGHELVQQGEDTEALAGRARCTAQTG